MANLLKPPIELRNGYKNPSRLSAIHNLPCSVCAKHGLHQVSRTEAHHIIGNGLGKKSSDNLTIALCSKHHARGNMGEAIHETPLKRWEEKFSSQQELLDWTNEALNGL